MIREKFSVPAPVEVSGPALWAFLCKVRSKPLTLASATWKRNETFLFEFLLDYQISLRGETRGSSGHKQPLRAAL